MKTVLDILLFPLGIFIEAFVGILYPVESATMRTHRRWALVGLAGCVGVIAMGFLLATITPHAIVIAPLIAIGLVFMFTFLIAGKTCADEAENSKKRNGS